MTADRWKELLDAVREKLGEGKVRGFGLNRYLQIPSPVGVGELRLGGGHYDGDAFVHSIYLIFHAGSEAPTDLRIGRMSKPTQWTKGWQELKTGDKTFDAQCQTWCKVSGKPGGMLSRSAREAFLGLLDLHQDMRLYVDGKDVTLSLPTTAVDDNRIADFVLKAVACVDRILAGR